MGHSPKSSKENSTVGDDDDVKQSKEEDEEDDDFDVEEDKDVVSQDGTSKLARENGGIQVAFDKFAHLSSKKDIL